MKSAFKISGLTKSFTEFKLGPIDLELEPGMVMGYIGPNGSGKTTTMHCMVGLVKPNAGEGIIPNAGSLCLSWENYM